MLHASTRTSQGASANDQVLGKLKRMRVTVMTCDTNVFGAQLGVVLWVIHGPDTVLWH